MTAKKPSTSPDRNTFQRENYIRRQLKENEPISQAYLDMFDEVQRESVSRFDQPENRENNLEWDLRSTDWILAKTRASKTYAQNLYAALCNNEFQRQEVIPILVGHLWSCTWRYAGGIIADMREEGDYIDWYCSGMRGGDEPDVYNQPWTNGTVAEGNVTEEIAQDLARLGWKAVDQGQD